MIKLLRLTSAIFIFVLGCKTIKTKQNTLDEIIIGKWSFIKATDSSGIEFTTVRDGNWGPHMYKVKTANIEFKQNKTFIKNYGNNDLTICNWKIKNDSIFQYGGQFDTISYKKRFEDFTQRIRTLNPNKLILELKPNLFFEYKKDYKTEQLNH